MKGIFYKTESRLNRPKLHICISKEDLEKETKLALSSLASYLLGNGDIGLPVQKNDGQFFIVNEKNVTFCGHANLYEENEYFLVSNLPCEMESIMKNSQPEATKELENCKIPSFSEAMFVSITFSLTSSYLPTLYCIMVDSL